MTRRGVVALCAAVALSQSCAVHGINIAQDDRLRIVTPRNYSTQRLPVRLEWEAHDVAPQFFALFVDRAPMPPGKDLRSLASRDVLCRATPGCPNDRWLRSHGVYLTRATTLELVQLADLGSRHAKDTHRVTIVLLDESGRRHRESAFSVTFSIDRRRV